MDSQETDILILGAGASGLFCALAASAGKGEAPRILVLEKNDAPGRKLLLAGGGKANVTNRSVSCRDYVGENPKFASTALQRYTPGDLLAFLEASGIAVEDREYGQIFCRHSAVALRDMLAARCRNQGCRLLTHQRAREIRASDHGFSVITETASFDTTILVLATGSPAWPASGADDSGLLLARSLGCRIVPLRPVLTPLLLPQTSPLPALAGISLPVRIRCSAPASPAFEQPLLFTHKGLSGPAALQISCWWRKGDWLRIDFLPRMDLPALLHAPTSGKATFSGLICRYLPARLARALIPLELAEKAAQRIAELSRADRQALCAAIQEHTVYPLRSQGLARAEACAGGIDTAGINPRTLESLTKPGLFFCGEALDIAGQLGGFNLHWAWASGRLAGQACRNALRKR